VVTENLAPGDPGSALSRLFVWGSSEIIPAQDLSFGWPLKPGFSILSYQQLQMRQG
jgi:hypothetical protein